MNMCIGPAHEMGSSRGRGGAEQNLQKCFRAMLFFFNCAENIFTANWVL